MNAEDDAFILPRFDSLEELVEFFETHDMGDYFDRAPKADLAVDLEAGYAQMARDEAREAEALEWAEATVGDVSNEGSTD